MTVQIDGPLKIGQCELYLGDSNKIVNSFADASIDCFVSSFPFYDRDLGFGDYKRICEHEPRGNCPYYTWYVANVALFTRKSAHYVLVLNSEEREKWIYRYSDPEHCWRWIKAPSAYRTKSNPIFVYRNSESDKNIIGKAWATIFWDRPLEGYSFVMEPIRVSDHPYEDPAKVYEELLYILYKLGCRSVCDPFMGKATTLVAALRTGFERIIGIEIDPMYFKLAENRIRAEGIQSHL
ncbi:MAG: site-specific DNA-methyltransferase [Patescibacteria group bacterium]|nr:site-specific DNA-methyltransferase [Patescibacteria group bacterium]